MGEIVIGVDAHKRSHTLAAVDEVGRRLGERTTAATSEGHLHALEWASRPSQRASRVNASSRCERPVLKPRLVGIEVGGLRDHQLTGQGPPSRE